MASADVQAPAALVISLPADLVNVVDRREFISRLREKSVLNEIKCVQTLSNGSFRVNCKTAGSYTYLTCNGLSIHSRQCTVVEAQPSFTFVRLFRCPYEVPEEAIRLALSAYGKIGEIRHEVDPDFKSIVTGTRIIKMQLSSPIPSRILIKRFPCNVWYRGQPKTCRICHSKDHEAPACFLKGRCRRCHEEGHMAKDCRNAWQQRREERERQDANPDTSESAHNPAPFELVLEETPAAEASLEVTDPAAVIDPPANLEPPVTEATDEAQTSEIIGADPPATEHSNTAPPDITLNPEESHSAAVSDHEMEVQRDSPTDPEASNTPSPILDDDGFVLVQSRHSKRSAGRKRKSSIERSGRMPSTENRDRSRSRSRSRLRNGPSSPTPGWSGSTSSSQSNG